MKVAISQSNYIPWKGYFDNIAQVDEFVLYDDMQYTKRDWRNRNKVKTAQGLKWLSIPVEVKGKYEQRINETRISDPNWNKKHLAIIKNSYAKASAYSDNIGFIEDLFLRADMPFLSEINKHFIDELCNYLGIKTVLRRSSDYELLPSGKTERLVGLCESLGATSYFTGAAAKDYMDEQLFLNKGIEVCYYDYSGYPEYRQLHGDFEHGVSILDLILNEGSSARDFLKTPKE